MDKGFQEVTAALEYPSDLVNLYISVAINKTTQVENHLATVQDSLWTDQGTSWAPKSPKGWTAACQVATGFDQPPQPSSTQILNKAEKGKPVS